MAVTYLSNGNAAGLWTTYVLKKFVPTLRENLILAQYAEPAVLPKGEGAAVARWNRMDQVPITDGLTALAETSTEDNIVTEITVTAVEATIGEYGQWMKIGSLAEDTVTTSALDAYRDAFAFAGAKLVETLIYNQAVTTSNFLNATKTTAGGTTLGNATWKLTAQEVAVVGSLLRGQMAQGFDSLNGKYAFLISPEQEQHLITDVTTARLSWADVKKNVSTAYETQIERKNNGDLVGSLGRVSVFLSDVVGTVTHGVSAWSSLAIARHGVGWLGLGEGRPKPKMIIKQSGPQDTSNALNMFMTIGYKIKMVAKLIDAARVFRVYSAE